jgi:hypothetical protein
MAREEGQWTAFRKFAAEEAVMFVPQAVNARQWLKGRADPPSPVVWQPHEVWMSWQRQKNGDYKWMMDQGDGLAAPLEAPELIAARIADCRSRPADRPTPQWTDGEVRDGEAVDGSLFWQVRVRPDGRRHVAIGFWDGSRWHSAVSAEAGP